MRTLVHSFKLELRKYCAKIKHVNMTQEFIFGGQNLKIVAKCKRLPFLARTSKFKSNYAGATRICVRISLSI